MIRILMTYEQSKFWAKYFDDIDDGRLISNGKSIPAKDIEQIKEFDDTNVELYEEHLIVDYVEAFKRN